MTVTGLFSSTALQSRAEPCLSLSTSKTVLPCSCNALAKWVAIVVLPLPPFDLTLQLLSYLYP